MTERLKLSPCYDSLSEASCVGGGGRYCGVMNRLIFLQFNVKQSPSEYGEEERGGGGSLDILYVFCFIIINRQIRLLNSCI